MNEWFNEYGIGISLAVRHAPKGGISIGRRFYEGGEFIPSEALEEATDEELARLKKKEAKTPKKEQDNPGFGKWSQHGVNSVEDLEKIFGLQNIPGAKIHKYEYDNDNHTLKVEIDHPDVSSWERYLSFTYKGKKAIDNSFLIIKKSAPKGLGLKIFTSQVEGAIEAGFDYIETYAVGNYRTASANNVNGYYTWAVFGYDCPLKILSPREFADEIMDMFPNAETLLDVITSPNVPNLDEDEADEIREDAANLDRKIGRPVRDRTTITGSDWWLVRGKPFSGTFDLAEGSRSRKQLDAYTRKAKARAEQNG